MLSRRILKIPSESFEIIQKLQQQSETLIVSDLRAKRDAQDVLMARDGFCLDDSVMRVSEFWKIWIRRLAPFMQFVDESVLKASVKKYLTEDSVREKLGVTLSEQEIDSALNFLWKAFPFVLQTTHQGVVSEWLEEREQELGREVYWKKWFRINQLCVDYIINQLHCLHPSWSSHFFSTQELEKVTWHKKLIVDLASEMTSVEYGLFDSLSSRLNIEIIIPPVQLIEKYSVVRKRYEQLGEIKKSDLKPDISTSPQIKRFSSSLSEIKFISSQIKTWLQDGISAENILIASPQIDSYWPILQFHLDHESVPYDYIQPYRLTDTELYQALRSRLKVLSDDVSWSAIEQMASVGTGSNNRLKKQFEQFKQRFFEVTESDELGHNVDWIAELKIPIFKNRSYTRLEYAQIVIAEFLKLNDSNSLEQQSGSFIRVLKDFLSNTFEISFPIKTWNEIFLSIVDRLDFSNQTEPLQAIRVRELNATLASPCPYRIIFGCDQKALTGRRISMIPEDDLRVLKNTLDFDVFDGEESHQDYYLNALIEFPTTNQIVTTALVGLNGEILETPALLLKQNLHPDAEFDQRGLLYSKQRALLMDSRPEVDELRSVQRKRFLTTATGDGQSPIQNLKISHFSATSLSDFKKCKFKFFANHLVQVRVPEVDSIELGPLKRGRILHRLFDFLSQKQFKIDELPVFLEQLRTDSRLFNGQELLWKSYQDRLQRIAKRFCEFEIERGSDSKIRFSEVAFDFIHQILDQSIRLKGTIDRIDVDPVSRKAKIYDYKTSKPSVIKPDKLLEKGEYQFFIYLLSLYQSDLKASIGFEAIENAQYYVIKNFEIKQGFKSEDELQLYLEQFKEILIQDYQELMTGKFPPKKEFDQNHCPNCDWKETCRAKHLN